MVLHVRSNSDSSAILFLSSVMSMGPFKMASASFDASQPDAQKLSEDKTLSAPLRLPSGEVESLREELGEANQPHFLVWSLGQIHRFLQTKSRQWSNVISMIWNS